MELDALNAGIIGQFIFTALLILMSLIIGYSIGHKEGRFEGYNRGRSIARHISAIKEVK